jgi:sugar-specific transcriptional regulator TrmB
MIKNKHIQSLMDFGLSLLQAKIYLTLVKLKRANVKSIAQASNVSRQDIYRILPALKKMGLAEKIIAKPTLYEATPMKLSLSILLQKKKQEYAELRKKEEWLLNNLNLYNSKNGLENDKYNFKITSEPTLLLRLHSELIRKTNETIDIIIPFITKPSKLSEEWDYLEALKSKKRSFKIRCISDKLKESPWKQQALENNANLEHRYFAKVPFGMHIFDKNEVTLSISQDSGLPCFWSNNLHKIYFQTKFNPLEEQLIRD